MVRSDERRRSKLPLLVGAAAAYAVGAAWSGPGGLLLAAAALTLLCGRGIALFVPFLLAGWWATPSVVADGRDAANQKPASAAALPALVEVRGRVARPTRATGSGGHQTLVALVSPVEQSLAGAQDLLIVESGSASRHERGDEVLARGTLLPAAPARNPGAASSGARLLAAGPSAVQPASDAAPPTFLECSLRWIDRAADRLEDHLVTRLPPAAAALALALLLGRTHALDPSLRQTLKSTGGWHFLSVSGTHVALVTALLAALLRRVLPREGWRSVGVLLGAVFYALLSGADAPALRATIGFLGLLPALALRRPAAPMAWLALAFLVLVAATPAVVTQIGFQLSFAAVLGLAVAARHGPWWSPRGTGRGLDFKRPLLAAWRGSWAATLATAPLTVWHFGSVTPLAPLTTFLLGPLIALALVASLLFGVLAWLPPLAGIPVAWTLDGSARAIAWLAALLDRLPATPLLVTRPPRWIVAALLLTWLLLLARRHAWAFAATLVAALAVAVRPSAPPSSFSLLAVGHGQTLLVRGGGRCDLFDAGGAIPPDELLRALAALQVDRLDALFLSHLDQDHAGYSAAIVAAFDLEALYVAPPAAAELAGPAPGPTLAELAAELARRAVPVVPLVAGARVGPHRCVWPPPDRRFSARNDGSLALVAAAGDVRLLLPGDLEGFPLLEMARNLVDPVDLLLLPHHGNADPGTGMLLRQARPRFALASRAESGLPEATRAALTRGGVPWLSTSRGGAIRGVRGNAPAIECFSRTVDGWARGAEEDP